LAPGIAAAFLLGVCSKKVTLQGGMWGLISGFIMGIIRLGAKVYYSSIAIGTGDNWFKFMFYDVNWLFFCGGMFITCVFIVIAVSMFTKAAPAEQIQGLTFGSVTPARKAATRASWDRWDVIHTCVIIGFTVLFYIYFW
jgi:SSS family solute:Na+ symporter